MPNFIDFLTFIFSAERIVYLSITRDVFYASGSLTFCAALCEKGMVNLLV